MSTIKEFETRDDICKYIAENIPDNGEKVYEVSTNDEGEICLYEKILIGKVCKDDTK